MFFPYPVEIGVIRIQHDRQQDVKSQSESHHEEGKDQHSTQQGFQYAQKHDYVNAHQAEPIAFIIVKKIRFIKIRRGYKWLSPL